MLIYVYIYLSLFSLIIMYKLVYFLIFKINNENSGKPPIFWCKKKRRIFLFSSHPSVFIVFIFLAYSILNLFLVFVLISAILQKSL